MKEQYITIKRTGIVRVAIKEEDGTDTGEFLEFDLESIELPLRIQESQEMHKKNLQYIKNQWLIIDKRQDHKGKKLFSHNEEEKIKAMNEFFLREVKALDLFLGKDGTKKILNGRQPYFSMYDDIDAMLKPVLPILDNATKEIEERIKRKYSKKETNVIE